MFTISAERDPLIWVVNQVGGLEQTRRVIQRLLPNNRQRAHFRSIECKRLRYPPIRSMSCPERLGSCLTKIANPLLAVPVLSEREQHNERRPEPIVCMIASMMFAWTECFISVSAPDFKPATKVCDSLCFNASTAPTQHQVRDTTPRFFRQLLHVLTSSPPLLCFARMPIPSSQWLRRSSHVLTAA
jgi:hypothetical protein